MFFDGRYMEFVLDSGMDVWDEVVDFCVFRDFIFCWDIFEFIFMIVERDRDLV